MLFLELHFCNWTPNPTYIYIHTVMFSIHVDIQYIHGHFQYLGSLILDVVFFALLLVLRGCHAESALLVPKHQKQSLCQFVVCKVVVIASWVVAATYIQMCSSQLSIHTSMTSSLLLEILVRCFASLASLPFLPLILCWGFCKIKGERASWLDQCLTSLACLPFPPLILCWGFFFVRSKGERDSWLDQCLAKWAYQVGSQDENLEEPQTLSERKENGIYSVCLCLVLATTPSVLVSLLRVCLQAPEINHLHFQFPLTQFQVHTWLSKLSFLTRLLIELVT